MADGICGCGFAAAVAGLPAGGAPMIGAPRPADGNGVRPISGGTAAGGCAAAGAVGGGATGGRGAGAGRSWRTAAPAELPEAERLPNTNATPTHLQDCRFMSFSISGDNKIGRAS